MRILKAGLRPRELLGQQGEPPESEVGHFSAASASGGPPQAFLPGGRRINLCCDNRTARGPGELIISDGVLREDL